MHHLMQGMFWGGLVMAIPPVIISVAVIVYLRKQQQQEAEPEGTWNTGERGAPSRGMARDVPAEDPVA